MHNLNSILKGFSAFLSIFAYSSRPTQRVLTKLLRRNPDSQLLSVLKSILETCGVCCAEDLIAALISCALPPSEALTSPPCILGTWTGRASTTVSQSASRPQQHCTARRRVATRSSTDRHLPQPTPCEVGVQGSANSPSHGEECSVHELWIQSQPSTEQTTQRGSGKDTTNALPAISIGRGSSASQSNGAVTRYPELVILYPHVADGCSFLQLPPPSPKGGAAPQMHATEPDPSFWGASRALGSGSSPGLQDSAEQRGGEVSDGLAWAIHHVNAAVWLAAAVGGTASSEPTPEVSTIPIGTACMQAQFIAGLMLLIREKEVCLGIHCEVLLSSDLGSPARIGPRIEIRSTHFGEIQHPVEDEPQRIL